MTDRTQAPAPFDMWHIGPWSLPAAAPGAPGVTGTVLTHHELMFDVVSLARRYGWREPDPTNAASLARVEAILEATPVGHGQVLDSQLAAVLDRVADSAYRWLAGQAPPGYRFDLINGLQLTPVNDLTAAVVPVEAVISTARGRGIAIPLDVEQLATAHINDAPDGWTAIHLPFRVAESFTTADDAIAAVERARAELLRLLDQANADDLIASRSRWAPVPVSGTAGH